jgi:hypothetical protein
VEDYDLPSSVISSRFIQIWPVADAVIIGIADGQTIGPVVPSVTFQLNDLYPDSTTWAQVYKGASQSAATGRTVPGSMVEINSATPQNRVVVVGNYLPLFDSDGLWTMEILTRTPFGTDRLSSVSFTVQGTGVIRENWRQFHFGSSANSGDGADLYDFDHDGIPNLVEFAFGLNPKQADSAVLPTPQLSGDQLAIMFTRPEEVAGITYAAEWSPDLLADSWQAVSDTGIFPQHAFSVPSVGNQRVFMRLKVTGQ